MDPRTEHSVDWGLPGARVVDSMPDEKVIDMELDERCQVVALMHDSELDDLV